MKNIKKIQELLDDEIWDYSWDYEIDCDFDEEDEEQYTVKITDRYRWKELVWYLTFRTDWEETKVELWEDTWEEIETFEWTIKYFWMALLMK